MKAAILGMGAMGRTHHDVYASLGYEIRTYEPKQDDESEMIDWADVVSVCSPDNFHADQVCKAFSLEKAVFCEKPLCHTRKDLEKIKSCYRGTRLGMNFPLRFHAPFIEARDRIEGLGDIYLIEADYEYGRYHKMVEGWRGRISDYKLTMGGGLHMIDLVVWMTGLEIWGPARKQDYYDSKHGFKICELSLARFNENGIFKLTCDFGGSKNHAHRLRICGTKDSLYVDNRESADKTIALKAFLRGEGNAKEIFRIHEMGLAL